ncbi:MAG: aldo/keto reductase, partial [Gammaproteobacteria bacterium]
MSESGTGTNRRRFFQYAAAVGIGGTGFRGSRLVFGCGASLARREKDRLLNTAFDAGINVFDVGTAHYYDMAERNMKNFLAAHRDDVFLISKASPGHADDSLYKQPGEAFTVEEARRAAKGWLELLDLSLSELGTDYVDAYYQMASNNTQMVGSEEIYRAFERGREAGKVRFYGLSTHQNADQVLNKAIDTGWYDLAMIAVTPGGWYDWEGKDLLKGSPPMAELKPIFDRARAAGIGLIGMKAARYFSSGFFGTSNQNAFDRFYPEGLLAARLSAFQRSYAFVLEHGLDAVNADIQNYDQLRENHLAAATSRQYFAA